MVIALRLGAAMLAALVVIGALGLFSVIAPFTGPGAEDVQDAARARPREMFWVAIFGIVMATSVLAAARRGADRLQRVVSRRR